MWTYNIDSHTFTKGVLTVVVTFTNPLQTDAVTVTFYPANDQSLKNAITQKLTELDALDVYAATIPTGQIDLTPVVVVSPVQTQAEKDQAQWFTDYQRWVKVKTTLIDTGIFNGTETPLATLKSKVQTNFKPTYFTLF
jgi:hypothetical protein